MRGASRWTTSELSHSEVGFDGSVVRLTDAYGIQSAQGWPWGRGELGGPLRGVDRPDDPRGSRGAAKRPWVDGCRESEVSCAWFSGKTMTMGSRGAWRLRPCGDETASRFDGAERFDADPHHGLGDATGARSGPLAKMYVVVPHTSCARLRRRSFPSPWVFSRLWSLASCSLPSSRSSLPASLPLSCFRRRAPGRPRSCRQASCR